MQRHEQWYRTVFGRLAFHDPSDNPFETPITDDELEGWEHSFEEDLTPDEEEG